MQWVENFNDRNFSFWVKISWLCFIFCNDGEPLGREKKTAKKEYDSMYYTAASNNILFEPAKDGFTLQTDKKIERLSKVQCNFKLFTIQGM